MLSYRPNKSLVLSQLLKVNVKNCDKEIMFDFDYAKIREKKKTSEVRKGDL